MANKLKLTDSAGNDSGFFLKTDSSGVADDNLLLTPASTTVNFRRRIEED